MIPDHSQDASNDLSASLGAGNLVLLGIGAIVGAGIFVATGVVAAEHAGPAVVLSFGIAAVGCLCAALCYAEFAAMMPVSGSAYSYATAAFGRLVGWIIGWCLMLEYLMAAATLAVGWSGYLSNLLATFGLHIPSAWASPPFGADGTQVQFNGPGLNAPAAAIAAAITWILLKGVRLSAAVNAALVLIKLSVIGLFVGVGVFAIDPANWQPFVPPNSGEVGEFGWSGVLRGAAVIFYAYLGFDAVSTAAREAKNPQRTVPIGIIGSLLICTLLYMLFAFVLTGIAPYHMLGTANPVATALDHAGPRFATLKVIVAGGALVGLTSVLMALLYGQSRILYAMSRDGVISPIFSRLDLVSRVPSRGILLSGLFVVLTAALFPITSLGEMISIGTLFAFVFVCAGVLVLRYRRPDATRPFRVPFVHLTCLGGILVCGYMMLSLPSETWQRFAVWMALGITYYFAWGRRGTRAASPEPAE